MQECWRWFGPSDPTSLSEVAETGATGIVTALHHKKPGEVWPLAEIQERQEAIQQGHAQLAWTVVESLHVSDDIKRQSGDWKAHIAAWKTSLEHLSAAGLKVICYNFMPVLDWTRTDLGWTLPSTSTCMRFDLVDFVAFDLYLLARKDADYDKEIVAAAEARFAAMDDARQKELVQNVLCGLPGTDHGLSLESVRAQLALYDGIGEARLRQHLIDFLDEVVPVADRLGVRMCCHPDDPPFSLLGLPRIMSTEADYCALVQAVECPANGITLCSGSLGARADNDLGGFMQRLGAHVHFIHLRNVTREGGATPCSFYESGHMTGDVDMVDLIAAIRAEEVRRERAGRLDAHIPFRPDHGLHMSSDRARDSRPGYPLVGRHVGLAELRGMIAATDRFAASGTAPCAAPQTP